MAGPPNQPLPAGASVEGSDVWAITERWRITPTRPTAWGRCLPAHLQGVAAQAGILALGDGIGKQTGRFAHRYHAAPAAEG